MTAHRRNILRLMSHKKKALSAYEITQLLKDTTKTDIPTMSVYRALSFLEDRQLIHKISSINKYTICTHIMCEHEHGMTRFAVCSKCLDVKELLSKNTINNSIEKELEAIDFHLSQKKIELIGLCSDCNKNL